MLSIYKLTLQKIWKLGLKRIIYENYTTKAKLIIRSIAFNLRSLKSIFE